MVMELDKIKEILKESIGAPTAKMDMNLSKILMSMIDSIARQDYIIFDAQGAQLEDITDELRAFVTKIYKTNPINLLSILLKDYCTEGDANRMTTLFSSFVVTEGGELELTSADNNLVVCADIS